MGMSLRQQFFPLHQCRRYERGELAKNRFQGIVVTAAERTVSAGILQRQRTTFVFVAHPVRIWDGSGTFMQFKDLPDIADGDIRPTVRYITSVSFQLHTRARKSLQDTRYIKTKLQQIAQYPNNQSNFCYNEYLAIGISSKLKNCKVRLRQAYRKYFFLHNAGITCSTPVLSMTSVSKYLPLDL